FINRQTRIAKRRETGAGKLGKSKLMIPGEFDYRRPATKSEALEMLAEGGDSARPIAGGHSLIPMMKLRMAAPALLIDIRRLQELRGIKIGGDICIGTAVTQHELIASEELAQACPIIRETALLIADPQIRYLGTLGGNVGNGDPGNDMPGLMQCLDATYILENSSGVREVKARDFYQGAYFTQLEAGEIISGIRFKRPACGHGFSYQKLKRKVGDYAMAAAAVIVEISDDTVKAASIGLTNLADTPLYASDAADALVGKKLDSNTVSAAVRAVEAIVTPAGDSRCPADYRIKMAGVMVRRALETAASRADTSKAKGIFGWLKS
ncbi:MAG: xanthine dehydrogenase family protein subunit M, partial [Pseudomonadota bacterium]